MFVKFCLTFKFQINEIFRASFLAVFTIQVYEEKL